MGCLLLIVHSVKGHVGLRQSGLHMAAACGLNVWPRVATHGPDARHTQRRTLIQWATSTGDVLVYFTKTV